MLALMKRQRLWPPLVALGLALAVALYALLSLGAVPGLFQYLWSAQTTSHSDLKEPDDAQI